MASSSVPNRYARDVVSSSELPPPINVRYFYTSPLAIDDPLSPIPPPVPASGPAYKQSPRPFSTFDNASLEKSWLEIRERLTRQAEDVQGDRRRSREATLSSGSQLAGANLAALRRPPPLDRRPGSFTESPMNSPRVQPRKIPIPDNVREQHRRSTDSRNGTGSASSSLRVLDPADASFQASDSLALTGNPFIRAPSRTDVKAEQERSRSASIRAGTRPTAPAVDSYNWGEDQFLSAEATSRNPSRSREPVSTKPAGPTAKVPVGVSRLHNVVFPEFQMEPIYWSPVNDISPIVRATWHYQENMLPVEPHIANLLESGYISLQVWTETWKDELNSALEVGATGEMKIVHKLWPDKSRFPTSRPQTARGQELSSAGTIGESSPLDPEKEYQEIAANAGDLIDVAMGPNGPDNKAQGSAPYGRDGTPRLYRQSGVIYANEKDAYILRPSLQPSDYYGRRPLANYIRKNRSIGIRVIRGFDQDTWDKLHPKKNSSKAKKAREGVSSSQAGAPQEARQLLDPTFAESERPEVTDLVLVIHGIGQKLSERVESYHFTHAINAFRREANVELGDDLVKLNLRKDLGGIMILPVNWRLNLSFEDGGYRDETDPAINDYTLKDITPETLPSVRNIVSDVMLDIPYYLSQEYSGKMIAAVVQEANRIYQTWCVNNPGFSQKGRVHLIAHSLGSVMAVDILSNQPTRVSHERDITKVLTADLPLDQFIFDVHSLFMAGSPAGFFLLLKRTGLLPRRGRNKPGAEDIVDDSPAGVAGERGTYGCLAVDNVYNVVNPYDPVAYNLNATVDANYAATLKPALVPSSAVSWLSFGKLSRTATGAGANSSTSLTLKPSMTNRLPSNVELETHNFTREEVAEKKVYLLNDNGQIDWFLRYGGGALEIQYLTMLGAHSSYWLSRDFVRMVVVEVGRAVGREGTVVSMRAQKRKKIVGTGR